MSSPRSIWYSLEQRAYMVEHFFCTNSLKLTQNLYKKKFKEVLDARTIKRVVERFQLAYMLEDEQKSGRPRALLDKDRTALKKHMEETPGMSARRAAAELGHSRETIHQTLKEEGFFPYRISVMHELKPKDFSSHYDYCGWFFQSFGRDV
ncbi:hypothetical protein PGB90_009545 [Kerria lacca]